MEFRSLFAYKSRLCTHSQTEAHSQTGKYSMLCSFRKDEFRCFFRCLLSGRIKLIYGNGFSFNFVVFFCLAWNKIWKCFFRGIHGWIHPHFYIPRHKMENSKIKTVTKIEPQKWPKIPICGLSHLRPKWTLFGMKIANCWFYFQIY